MTRDELVEAVCLAVHSGAESGGMRRTCPTGVAVLDAIEPLIRADERARILDSLHTQRELADDDQRWADLRAKVEALRGKWQRSVDRDPGGKLSGYDRAHVAALGDVLDLIDGGSDA